MTFDIRNYPDLWVAARGLNDLTDPLAKAHLQRIYDRGVAFGTGYGTHIPALAAAITLAPHGHVLELGAGRMSTLLLHTMCKTMGRTLYTLDSSMEWLSMFDDLATDHHYLIQVDGEKDWNNSVDQIGVEQFAVILIDQEPGWARLESLKYLRNRAEIIVCHDMVNPWFVGMDEELDKFRYRANYLSAIPFTTVVSNSMHLGDLDA